LHNPSRSAPSNQQEGCLVQMGCQCGDFSIAYTLSPGERGLRPRYPCGIWESGARSRESQNEEGVAGGGGWQAKAPASQEIETLVVGEREGKRALRRPGLADLSPGVSPDFLGPNYGRPPMI